MARPRQLTNKKKTKKKSHSTGNLGIDIKAARIRNKAKQKAKGLKAALRAGNKVTFGKGRGAKK